MNELDKSPLILILAVGLLYSAAIVSIIVVWKPIFESTLYKNDHLTELNAFSASKLQCFSDVILGLSLSDKASLVLMYSY